METRESIIKCPQCSEDLELKDLAAYQGLCYHCFCDVEDEVLAKRPGYVYGDIAQMAKAQEIEEGAIFGTDDPFHGSDLTICCDEDPDHCECEFPEKGPIYEVAFEKYLGILPENIYDTSSGVPCIESCDNAWMGGCLPLRQALHMIHMHQEMIASGAEDLDELYIGSIDGCINYTKRIEDYRVSAVRIERDI